MLAPSPAYSAENTLLSRTPIYRVEFVRNAVSVGKFSTLPVLDNSDWLPYIESVQGLEAHVEPDRGRTSQGSIVLTITDRGQVLTALVSGDGIGGDVVTFQKGFENIADGEFQTFRIGRVESCRLTPDLGAYEFTIRDPQALLNRDIYEVASSPLTIDLATGATTELFIEDASGFATAGVVRIDDEYIEYSGTTPTSLTGLTRGFSPASSITLDADHAAGVAVQEVLNLGPGHPLDARVGVFVNTDKSGLSIDPSAVDLVTHDAVKAAIGDTMLMQWLLDKPANAEEWIQSEIDKPLGLYARTTGDGKLSVVNSLDPGAPVATIDTNNALTEEGGAQILSYDLNLQSVINAVVFYYGWDGITAKFTATLEVNDAASITKFGRRPLVIESKGFHPTLAGTTAFLTEIADRILNRYSQGAALVTASVFLKEHLIEPGDVLSLTSPDLPNLESGVRGLNGALVETLQRNIAFNISRTELTMQLAQVCFQWLTDWSDPAAVESLASIGHDNTFFYIGTSKGPGTSEPSIGRFSRRSGTIVDAVEIPRRWTTGTATVISIISDPDYLYALVNENDGGSQSEFSLHAITHATFTSTDVIAERLNWLNLVLREDLVGPGFVSAGQMKLAGNFLYVIGDENTGDASTFLRVAKDFSSVESFNLATFVTKRFTVDDANDFLYATGNWGDEAGDEFTIVRVTLEPSFAYDTRLKVDTTDDQGGYDPANLPIADDPTHLFVDYFGVPAGTAKVTKSTFTLHSLNLFTGSEGNTPSSLTYDGSTYLYHYARTPMGKLAILRSPTADLSAYEMHALSDDALDLDGSQSPFVKGTELIFQLNHGSSRAIQKLCVFTELAEET